LVTHWHDKLQLGESQTASKSLQSQYITQLELRNEKKQYLSEKTAHL